MNFELNRGDADIFAYPKTASTAFSRGDAVELTSGYLTKAGATATPATVVGIIKRDVTASDDDYADTTDTMVEIPEVDTIYKAKVGAGTPAQTMVGQRYDLDANGQVDLTAQLNKVVEVVRLAQESGYVYVRFIKA